MAGHVAMMPSHYRLLSLAADDRIYMDDHALYATDRDILVRVIDPAFVARLRGVVSFVPPAISMRGAPARVSPEYLGVITGSRDPDPFVGRCAELMRRALTSQPAPTDRLMVRAKWIHHVNHVAPDIEWIHKAPDLWVAERGPLAIVLNNHK